MNGAFLHLLSINSIKNFQSFQVFNQEIKLVSHMCYQILIDGKKIKTFHQGTYLLDTE